VATIDVQKCVIHFIKYLNAKGYAKATIQSYRHNLNCFERYLENAKITDIKYVTAAVIAAYEVKIMSEPIVIESKGLKLRVVRKLFKYLIQTRRLLIDPASKLKPVKRRKAIIGTVLTPFEIKILMDQPDIATKFGIRDRAILETLYSTGLRANELINLELYDLDVTGKVLFVRQGKGKKDRVVPVGKTALSFLSLYLQKVRPWFLKRPSENCLFINKSGKRFTGLALRMMIRKYRLASGIPKKISTHTFRRSCATHMVQNGADIRYVQALLGHKKLSTTELYTKIIPMDVKTMHDTTHPGDTFYENQIHTSPLL